MEYVLNTTGLSKSFSGKKAVNDVSMKVKKGDIYGFIGKNGAGKTTLIRMAVGLAKASEGKIELFGSTNLTENLNRIGTVIEYPAIYPNLTAEQNLVIQCKLQNIKNKNIINETLDTVGLNNTGKKKAKNFSLGMKQRLAIAIALIGSPELLILDEPTNGLDPEGIREVRELIQKLNREKQITVLISSHILGELSKLATCYGIIHDGSLIQEFSEAELLERCKSNLVIKVASEDFDTCITILEQKLDTKNYKVTEDKKIMLYDYIDDSRLVNKTLSENGVLIESISVEAMDLEDYFMKTIGGLR